jgi:hypothetical protein
MNNNGPAVRMGPQGLASFLAFAVAFGIALFTMGLHGGHVPSIMLLALLGGLFPLGVLLAIVGARRHPALEAPQAEQARLEQAILRLAKDHEGRVNPAMVAMQVRGVTVARARELLEALSGNDVCTAESDDQGHLYYVFTLSAPAAAEDKPTAEAWVAAQGRRMSVDEASETREADA